MTKRLISILLTLGALAAVAGISISSALASRPSELHSRSSTVRLNGSGSTFDAPLFAAAFPHYGHGVTVSYDPVGSGTGQKNLEAKLDDFGAFDVPMMKADLHAAKGPIVQFPVTLGGVSIIYHVKGVSGLKLSGPVLANIYMGKITKWNDKAIKKLNKGKKLPNEAIAVVHRSDSSGTSYIFTDYLSNVSKAWKKAVGTSKTPPWPTGSAGKGSSQVSALVKSTEGGIGYVELAYALQNKIATAAIENRAGKFVHATLQSVLTDARKLPNISATHFSIVNAKGKASYPISGYSWVGVYKVNPDKAKRTALVGLFRWLVNTGQKYSKPNDYVPLPKAIRKYDTKQLAQVKG
ncbi:MAG TPA: phosphate ABC transporter substrate-binding protein PstS [Chloroflexota bacterium]|nr:phosphate ABC transporter substrate-binding protein PstS [Chloroflexota bacterium]